MDIELSKFEDSTVENEEVWTITTRTTSYRYAATNTEPTTYAGNLASYPQTISTINQLNSLQGTVTLTAFETQSIHFSKVLSASTPHWIEVKSYESPPLTEQELHDIHQGILEIKSGKAKHFKSMRETIEWLHRKRDQ